MERNEGCYIVCVCNPFLLRFASGMDGSGKGNVFFTTAVYRFLSLLYWGLAQARSKLYGWDNHDNIVYNIFYPNCYTYM